MLKLGIASCLLSFFDLFLFSDFKLFMYLHILVALTQPVANNSIPMTNRDKSLKLMQFKVILLSVGDQIRLYKHNFVLAF